MGREVRMVPPNWDHPKENIWGDVRLQPMYDKNYEQARQKWIDEFRDWYANGKYEENGCDYWEWDNPPDKKDCRPWKDEEATWFQVWETVSEGTPVTPPFATQDELVDYLAANGDFWDQKRGDKPCSREVYDNFVKGSGWAPSFVIVNGVIKSEIKGLKNEKPATGEK